ncbi:MAG: hypothetical protein KKG75_01600 [Nanoarchaeota archaeon]|nr:hypothetical protein [Nanoarchaeota archaeon]
MVTKSNFKDIPVKLDLELKQQIESYISKGENRFSYPSVKNFVDKAVLRLLKEVSERSSDKEVHNE